MQVYFAGGDGVQKEMMGCACERKAGARLLKVVLVAIWGRLCATVCASATRRHASTQ